MSLPEPLVKKDWSDVHDSSMEPYPLVLKTGRKLIWILSSVLIIILVIIGYFVLQFLSVEEVSFKILAPESVNMGVPFDLTVSFRNDSARVLRDAKLVFNIPEGVVFLGRPVGENLENRALNDIGAGSFIKETFRIMFIDGENVAKKFEAVISYNPDALGNARFEKKSSIDIVVSEPVIKMDISLPEKVLSGDQFDIKLNYQNIGLAELKDLELELKYPREFIFKSANPEPMRLNNFWDIGNLLSGSEGEIIVRGAVTGQDNANFPLEAKLTAEILGERYTISSKLLNLVIAASPLSMNILVNGDEDLKFVRPGDKLNFRINYKNMTNVSLQSVVIKIQFIGDLYNLGTLNTNGFFSSLDNTITWNVANAPELKLVDSNSGGNVDFAIEVRSDFIPKRLSDKNFYLKLRGEIESPTVPSYIKAERTVGFSNFEIKVAGGVVVDAKIFFRDALSGILNSGSIPPKVDTPTEYTIHWVINNYITDVKNIRATAFLQAGVSWTNQVKSNVGSIPTYDPNTQEVSWVIDRLGAGRGFVNPGAEAIFQVKVIPSTLDSGKVKNILSPTALRAEDIFIESDIVASDLLLSTELIDDPTVIKEDGVVVK